MIRINLLPHREEKRRAKRRQFIVLSGLVVLLAACIVLFVHEINASRIRKQEEKNAFLRREIALLDKEITEIKRLKEEMRALLDRKRVIETLQENRAEAVTLLNDLARLTPEGVYLKSLRQSGQGTLLVGLTQSDARVSTLMRAMEGSKIFHSPRLVEIRAVGANKGRLAQFTLSVQVRRAEHVVGSKP